MLLDSWYGDNDVAKDIGPKIVSRSAMAVDNPYDYMTDNDIIEIDQDVSRRDIHETYAHFILHEPQYGPNVPKYNTVEEAKEWKKDLICS